MWKYSRILDKRAQLQKNSSCYPPLPLPSHSPAPVQCVGCCKTIPLHCSMCFMANLQLNFSCHRMKSIAFAKACSWRCQRETAEPSFYRHPQLPAWHQVQRLPAAAIWISTGEGKLDAIYKESERSNPQTFFLKETLLKTTSLSTGRRI